MKMMAALRNQFGGHAVDQGRQGRGREARLDDARPSLADRLPVLRRGRAPARPGRHGVRRPQRAGQDQPGRGGRLPRDPRVSHRVAPDAPLVRLGAERAVVRGQVVRDDRPPLVEVEINPGRANRARINRSPVPRAREVLGIAAHACCSRPRTWPWSRATPASGAGSSTTCWSRARRASPACGPTTTGCSSSATRCSSRRARRGGPSRSTCARSTSGTPTWRPRAPSCWPAGSTWSTRCARWSTSPTRRCGVQLRLGRPGGGRLPQLAVRAARPPGRDLRWSRQGRRPAGRRPRPAGRGAAGADGDRRKAELERGVSLVGPHRDELRPQARRRCRPRATPATASPGRSRWRCGWRRTTCCARADGRRAGARPRRRLRRARRPTAASGWPSWSPAPSRCWSRPRSRATSPRRCPGRGSTSWAPRYGGCR